MQHWPEFNTYNKERNYLQNETRYLYFLTSKDQEKGSLQVAIHKSLKEQVKDYASNATLALAGQALSKDNHFRSTLIQFHTPFI